jgi:GTPase
MTFEATSNAGVVARGERAVLALPERGGEGARRSTDARLDEARGLAEAIGVDVVASRALRLRTLRPATLFGKGQAEEISALVRGHDAKLLIVDAVMQRCHRSSRRIWRKPFRPR